MLQLGVSSRVGLRPTSPVMMSASTDAVHAHAHALAAENWEALASRLPPRSTRTVTYSRKVFIPLTRLCQDSCAYCTFALHDGLTSASSSVYLTPDEVLEIARRGEEAGCTEALFTLGDRPEVRWTAAREELHALGHETTVSYLLEVARLVLTQTSLLPHTNPGILSAREMAALRTVAVSQGLMLESLSRQPFEAGGAHQGCRTKQPALRLRQLNLAGRLRVPFTTGLLLGLGESRSDTIDGLLAIRRSHERFGHVQELIIQPFRPKDQTRMAASAPFPEDELFWAVAAAKLILGPCGVPVQSPPNLSCGAEALRTLLRCGVDDWGGVSPGVTPDHVNPEAAWPEVESLREHTEAEGLQLVPRLPAYPPYVSHRSLATRGLGRWQHAMVAARTRRLSDGGGYARGELPLHRSWHSGLLLLPPSGGEEPELSWLPFGHEFEGMVARATSATEPVVDDRVSPDVADALAAALRGEGLGVQMIERLLSARGPDLSAVCVAADQRRRQLAGPRVSFVVCRNIQYTNRCAYACSFCAFSKGTMQAKGVAYEIDGDEISRRAAEAWERGATEVCMQGGIDPQYTGDSYVHFLRSALRGEPRLHVHAFSPLEISQGASSLGRSTHDFLQELCAAGLGSLPGTSAEILSDEVRSEICPDKLSSRQWSEVVREAHAVGLPTTSTIMFGHVEGYAAIARHLKRLHVLQERSVRAGHAAAITEFVPLPFVHPEAPVYRSGGARRGPTLREAVLVHALGRLALPSVASVQVSWTKMGRVGAAMALRAGANDLGGTLMSESISRAAGASHGQEMTAQGMQAIVDGLPADPEGCVRSLWQRTTLYDKADDERTAAAAAAAPLVPVSMGG